MAIGGTILAVLASVLGVALAVLIIMFILVPIFKGVGWAVRQVARFVTGEVGDALRIVGAVITNIVLIPLTIGSIVIGRWSATAHYGRAIQSEFATIGACLYRIAIGHPARLLCLTALTEGLEQRLPEVVAVAPGSDRPVSGRAGQFAGYTIVGSLPGGGSGGRLYVAEPDELKKAAFARQGRPDVEQVVIKAFSLRDGSSLPQIVRESRALDAARKLGLVLEHELSDERFYYVTKYVPGEPLGLVTQRLHAQCAGDGLDANHLRVALGYGADLLRTLDAYHRGGLWHKDVKPDNIIVDGQAAHLVDFGLITPLRSAMTLTTHGTEYFRDPEMVRLALKGVRVHQVDGAKFDVYAAGAVLFSVIENSFPAHGGLSQVTKKCPEALRWIIRRAMTEYDRRYPSASLMLADLEAVRLAADPFAVRPADLPSMREGDPPEIETLGQDPLDALGVPRAAGAATPGMGVAPGGPGAAAGPAAIGAGVIGDAAQAPPAGRRVRPRIRVAHWWSGRYQSDAAPAASPAPTPRKGFVFTAGFRDGRPYFNIDRGQDAGVVMAAAPTPRPPRPPRAEHRSAADQLASARARVQAARERARQRLESRRGRSPAGAHFEKGFNPGVAAALFVFLGACVALVGGVLYAANGRGSRLLVFNTTEQVSLSARLDVPPAPEAPVPVIPAADRNSRPGKRGGARVEPALSAAASPDVPPGRLLVVNDLPKPMPAITERAVQAACERLRGAGFELLGNYPGNPASAEELGVQGEMEAVVRAVRGLTPLDSDEAVATLTRWLSEDGHLQGLVWLTPRRESATGAESFVYFPGLDPRNDRGEYGRAVIRQKLVERAMLPN